MDNDLVDILGDIRQFSVGTDEPIDSAILPFCDYINKLGFRTFASCDGAKHCDPYVTFYFYNDDSLKLIKFLQSLQVFSDCFWDLKIMSKLYHLRVVIDKDNVCTLYFDVSSNLDLFYKDLNKYYNIKEEKCENVFDKTLLIKEYDSSVLEYLNSLKIKLISYRKTKINNPIFEKEYIKANIEYGLESIESLIKRFKQYGRIK